MRYLWMLYRQGKLDRFCLPDVGLAEFKLLMPEFLSRLYDFAWIIEGPTPEGFRPLCMFFGKDNYRFILLCDMLWMPWATPRNKVEAYTTMVVVLRRDLPIYFYMEAADEKFGVYLMKLGIVRTVGRLEEIGVKFYEARGVLK